MGLDVGQQPLKRWPFRRASGIAAVIIEGGKGNPALVPLTLYICVAGLALGMQGVEILFQSLFRGFSGVNRAAKSFVGDRAGLRTSIARISFRGRNRSGLRIKDRMQLTAARAGCIFIRRWRAFNAEEGISVPVGAGDSVGDRRERLIGPPVPFEPLVQSCDLMGGVLPLSDHLRAGLNTAAAEQGVRITISNGVGDFPQPTFSCGR